MKVIKYITGMAIALTICNGCSEWLDVTPRSEVKETTLFTSEDGFKKALNGAYILLAQKELYGKNTSMYLPELWSRHWTIPAVSTTDKVATEINRISNFDYTHSQVEPLIAQVWLNYYKVIVQLNDILEHLENSTVRFEYNNDALIKGEALGLRAFLHLELLRYFAPLPTDQNKTAIAIPYVTKKTIEPVNLVSLSSAEVIQHIEEDLNAAEELLKDIDPILSYTNNELNLMLSNRPKDDWQCKRQGRFNYYAVLGAKARFYQWTGDKAQAVVYAKKVIDAENKDASKKFTLTKESDYNASSTVNLTMYNEVLFAIHNPELQKIVEPLFKAGDARLAQTVTYLNTAYESTVYSSDIRYKPSSQATRYWEEVVYENSRKVNHFRKYTGNNQIATNNRVPLLRLAEMYLIMVEDLPLAEAKNYFSTYRIARSLDASIETSMADESARKTRLEKEYRKEFFGEGQMFFFYKRFDYKSYTWPANYTLPVGAYVVPKPAAQISFE